MPKHQKTQQSPRFGITGTRIPETSYLIQAALPWQRPARNYKISTATEVDRFPSLTLEAGRTRYVRLDPTFGRFVGHISPALGDAEKGQDEIKDCHYIGNK